MSKFFIRKFGDLVILEKAGDNKGCGSLLVGILLIIGAIKLFNIIENWQQYTPFNKVIAGIYYFVINIPIKIILYPINYIYDNQLTEYKNINLILTIIGIIILIIVFFFLLILISRISYNNIPIGGYLLSLIYFAPILIWLIVNATIYIFNWLFTQ